MSAVLRNLGVDNVALGFVAGFLAGWLSERDYRAAHRMGAAAFSDGLAAETEVRALLRRDQAGAASAGTCAAA